MTTFDQYQITKKIRSLNGLRTVSVVLVLSWHTGDTLWKPAHGYLGVTLFFVISGYLITTLLLREEDTNGRVSISQFYVRRAFRILPLYFLILFAYVVMVMGLGIAGVSTDFGSRLLLLGTMNGEFAGPGWFSHSWSLGIEEKFYALWPIIGFTVVPFARHRLGLIVGLLVLALVSAPFEIWNYFAIYVPIIGGALIAVLMNEKRTYRYCAFIAKPLFQAILVAAMIFALALNNEQTFVHIPFSILAVLAIPSFVVGGGVLNTVLNWRLFDYIGQRSYAIYLVHIVVLLAVSRVLHEDGSPAEAALRLLAALGVSVFVAEVLFRVVEAPLIRVGHRVTIRHQLHKKSGAIEPRQ
jgi:peptidoglycan/LPS O-acetylase OafA/YrhL